MKDILLLLLVVFASALIANDFELLVELSHDLDGDGNKELLEIYNHEYYPGDFEFKFCIAAVNDTISWEAKDFWSDTDIDAIKSDPSERDELIRIIEYKKDEFAFYIKEHVYDGGTSPMFLIGINKDDKPEIIMNEELKTARDIDFNGDGTKEIVGVRWWRQQIDESDIYQQYCPSFVYSMKNGNYAFDSELTKKYNIDNGGVWCGEERNDNIIVVRKPGEKPYVISSEEFDRIRGLE